MFELNEYLLPKVLHEKNNSTSAKQGLMYCNYRTQLNKKRKVFEILN